MFLWSTLTDWTYFLFGTMFGYFYGSYILAAPGFTIELFFWILGMFADCFWFRYKFNWFDVPIAAYSVQIPTYLSDRSKILRSPLSIVVGSMFVLIAISLSLSCRINPYLILCKFILINPINLFVTAFQNSIMNGVLPIFLTSLSPTMLKIWMMSVKLGPNVNLYFCP